MITPMEVILNPKSGYIFTNDIKIHFEVLGDHKPPLIMCHGITDNGRCLLRLGEHLASDYQVYMVDARGHGFSDAPESGYTADHHADDLFGLVKSLGLEKSIFYGHSMGARTISRFAAKYPDSPKAIILEDPVYIIPPSEIELAERDKWLLEMVEEVSQWQFMTIKDHLETARQLGHRDWTADEQLEWAKSKHQVNPSVFEIGMHMQSVRADFPLINCPVLILKADTDFETKKQNEIAANLIAHSKIIHVPDAGHNVRRDNYLATLDHLDKFLGNL